MKRITNWRSATVADLESDDLLRGATLIHVVSMQLASGGKVTIDGDNLDRIRKFFSFHINSNMPVVFHNGICFDIPLCEKLLGMDLSKLMVIDSLALSWYLNTNRKQHGLGTFHKEYGIEKPVVGEEEWKTPVRLSEDSDRAFKEKIDNHKALMKTRCQEDVRINVALWNDLKERLIEMYTLSKGVIDSGKVGGKRTSPDETTYLDKFRNTTSVDEWIDEILTFLMLKMDNVRIKEATMWGVDVDKLNKLHDHLNGLIEPAKKTLESVMPDVPKYAKKKFPKKPTRKAKPKELVTDLNFRLSASGLSWNTTVDGLYKKTDLGHYMTLRLEGVPHKVSEDKWFEGQYSGVTVRVLKGYEPPNVGSPDQLKAFLYSHGWKPETFELVDDNPAIKEWEASGKRGKPPKKRQVPQISKVGENGKELCPSVVMLADKIPEIMAYQKYTTIKHRRDMVKGFIANLIDGKYLVAGCGGYTSTLREQHRGLVNLPGEGKPYWEEIRGCLIAGEGNTSLGSDLSALEDRVKQHFMIPHDPEYAAIIGAEGFCPHIDIATLAKFLTKAEEGRYYSGEYESSVEKSFIKAARKRAKPVNYGGQYGQTAKGLATSAGIPIAQAEELSRIYWERNWSVKAIADEQVVVQDSRGGKWLVNPINGLCYSLRAEKDRFSALCQGTGSYLFDMWVANVMERMYAKWGVKRLNGLFHDEFITSFGDSEANRDAMEEITHKALEDVNSKYLLRRELGCDVIFGSDYSKIH